MEQKPRQKKQTEIDLIPILKTLLSKIWLMILIGAVTAGIAFGMAKLLIKPTYRCGFTAYVNNQHAQADKSMLSNQDLIAAQQLTKTFSYILKSNTILTASLESINSDMTYGEFSSMVRTEIMDETELISVYVVNEDPKMAYKLANAIAKTAPAYMSEIVEGSSMKIVDYPEYTDARYKPNYFKYGLLGFLGGFLLVAVIVLIKFFRNDNVNNEAELELRFSIPVLGVIPDIKHLNQNGSNYYYSNSYGYAKSSASAGKGDNDRA